jgi:hypothetical protein
MQNRSIRSVGFQAAGSNPPVPASTLLALFGTQVQATTPRSGTRLSEVPGKGTVSCYLFAMQEEAFGGARSRLEDFQVGLDGVRSLLRLVSCIIVKGIWEPQSLRN